MNSIISLGLDDAASLLDLQKGSPGRPWSLAETKTLLEDPTIRGWGVREGTALQGFILIRMVAESADILDFVVSKAYRSQGVGSRLYQHMERMCKKNAIKEILLEVSVNNSAALSFYHKNHFKKVGVRSRYYSSPNGLEDGVLMKKTIILG